MFVPFESLPSDSRIWIYQSDKQFSEASKKLVATYLHSYCDSWTVHGQPLKTSFEIHYDRFIILAVDESFNSTSGCSIDASVRAIKEIESLAGISLLNRNLIPFLIHEQITVLDLSSLKENFNNGVWNESTLTFNNLINVKGQLTTDWIKPAGETWLERYLPKETVKS